MEYSIRIADKKILIRSVYDHTRLCEDYLTDGSEEPDIGIRTDREMIRREAEYARRMGENPHSLKATEELLIHRIIAETMPYFDAFLIHGAVIAVGSVCFLFSGKSGTGKTTHIRKWLENVPGSYIVNGDKPLIKLDGDKAFACGNPWRGKEDLGTNTIVPLRSIVFMERSDKNRMEGISFRNAFPLLLEQVYQPLDPGKMRKMLALLSRLKDSVSFYRFYFDNYQEDAFSVSFEELVKRGRDL